MKRWCFLTLSILAVGSPARGDLNAYYRGVDRFSGAESVAVVQVSISKDRVAFVIRGSRHARLLYWKDRRAMRLVDDTGKSYLDLERCTDAEGGLISTVQGKLSQLSPQERALAEQMIQGSLSDEGNASKTEFVRTKNARKVLGRDCTMVQVRRGGETRAEYCACASPDFKLSGAERATVSEADSCIHNLFTLIQPARGDPSGAFEWDTSADAFPLLSRCLDGETVTLEVTMESFDRASVADSLFTVPASYAKLSPAQEDSTDSSGE